MATRRARPRTRVGATALRREAGFRVCRFGHFFRRARAWFLGAGVARAVVRRRVEPNSNGREDAIFAVHIDGALAYIRASARAEYGECVNHEARPRDNAGHLLEQLEARGWRETSQWIARVRLSLMTVCRPLHSTVQLEVGLVNAHRQLLRLARRTAP